jgi:hypothetical protein
MKNKLIILIVLICILLLLLVLNQNKSVEGYTNTNFELVISRYQENLDWVHELPKELLTNITIYNKGDDFNFDFNSKIIKLPNYGRESHTYLYHVINNYDNLADLTFFLPGSVRARDDKWDQVQKILKNLNTSSLILGSKNNNEIQNIYNFTIDKWLVTNSENRKKNPSDDLTPASIRPYGKWFKSHFPNEDITCLSATGIILASKEDILKRPKEFYVKLFEEHLFENTEVVHYSERSWKTIFSISDEHCL